MASGGERWPAGISTQALEACARSAGAILTAASSEDPAKKTERRLTRQSARFRDSLGARPP
jgi:hypothetical protein